jgi:hypothetical protein
VYPVWHVAHVAKLLLPPEPAGATAWVVTGGAAWQIAHDVAPAA